MFHLTNKSYLEYDFKFTLQYPYAVASDRWSEHPLVDVNHEAAKQEPSFPELLENEYENDLEKKTHKFVLYVDPDTFLNLQIQYWKSLYKGISLEDTYFLYKTYVESVRLNSYIFMESQWEPASMAWSKENILSEVKLVDFTKFKLMFNKVESVKAIENMDKRRVSFEYLLIDYFADENSPYRLELLDRVKKLTWDNWLDELEHLKYEILSGALDAHKLDPNIETNVGSIEEGLSKSDILSWTVDPLFNENVDYIRQTYDHRIFVPCWQRLADQWGVGYDDMDELNELINSDNYEELLRRDIARGYGCSYTRTRFMNKANQVLATWCYERVRQGDIPILKRFSLTR
jgi:hypothetical protein